MPTWSATVWPGMVYPDGIGSNVSGYGGESDPPKIVIASGPAGVASPVEVDPGVNQIEEPPPSPPLLPQRAFNITGNG